MSRNRFDSLDSLRAFACLFVIWQHVSEHFQNVASSGLWTTALANHLDFGRIGVIAFFCISGFVIPSSLSGDRLHAVRTFAINRFFRLYPIFWISIPPALLFVWHATGRSIGDPAIAANLTMLPTFFGSQSIQGLYWTLEVELFFYIACALFYLIFGNLKTPALLVAFAIFYLLNKFNPLASTPGNFPILFFHLSIMFAAASLRGVFEYIKQKPEDRSQIQLIVYSLFVLYAGYLVTAPVAEGIAKSFVSPDPVWSKYGYGNTIGIALFIIFLTNQRTPAWLARIGRYTYSAYLAHGIVLYATKNIIQEADIGKAPLLLHIGLVSLITFIVAATTYRLVEAPSVKLGRYLNAKLDTRREKKRTP